MLCRDRPVLVGSPTYFRIGVHLGPSHKKYVKQIVLLCWGIMQKRNCRAEENDMKRNLLESGKLVDAAIVKDYPMSIGSDSLVMSCFAAKVSTLEVCSFDVVFSQKFPNY